MHSTQQTRRGELRAVVGLALLLLYALPLFVPPPTPAVVPPTVAGGLVARIFPHVPAWWVVGRLIALSFGAILIAVIAIVSVGGLGALDAKLAAAGLDAKRAFFPALTGAGIANGASLGIGTFLAYVGIQWWAFRRSDGGGEFVQRLSASRDEDSAEKAAMLFNILHYVVRTWPWVLVALVALVIYPELLHGVGDPELSYPKLMLHFLPVGVLGLVVASLVAAFMSVASVHINWGASYITNDLYRRFVHEHASQRELVWVGRIASIVLAVLGAWVAFHAQSIGTIFTFIIAIGTGPGAVLILRWFWWRINAWAELASMVAGLLIALVLYTPNVHWGSGVLGAPLGSLAAFVKPISDLGPAGVLTITALGTGVIWVIVMLVTKPESDAVLDRFYRRARPGGPGWRRQRARTGLDPLQDLGGDLLSALWGIFLIFGLMFAIGGVLLFKWWTALASVIITVVAWFLIRRQRRLEGVCGAIQPS